jgi:protein-S-isoprenylcysteine O-methyltransferase Ste14
MFELRIPPPVVAALTAVMMWAMAWLLPLGHVAAPGNVHVAIGVAVLGILIGAAALAQFRSARTTVNPMTPDASTALVAGGVYQVTRNPMYLGMALILLGWALYLSNVAALVGLPIFVLYITRFQIVPEERALEARFGSAFSAYRQSVRRWI